MQRDLQLVRHIRWEMGERLVAFDDWQKIGVEGDEGTLQSETD